jgi:5-methylcytosine-specific restriction endonuclease McrA
MKSTIEKVIQTYLEIKSIRKTAELTGYSKSGVEYLLKANSIALFARNRGGSESSSSKAILELDPSDPRRLIRDPVYMNELYINKKMSLPDIASLLGLDSVTVLTGLKQCGIKRRTKKESTLGKAHPNAQGSKNHNWKGGLSGWRKLARGRLNEHFVSPIMKRDNFSCQWCGSKKNIVVHHHKRSFMEIVNLVRQKCDETDIDRFVTLIVSEHSLEDGITICKICHDNYHKEHGK